MTSREFDHGQASAPGHCGDFDPIVVRDHRLDRKQSWTRFGEGNSLNNNPRYTSQDIRFTTKGETLYAIFLA